MGKIFTEQKNDHIKLLIVDGHNLLFQMFCGMPSRIVNASGKPIHGTLGFVGALLKMIRILKPSHICVIFDGETFNPRKTVNEEYKANRPDFSALPDEETPFSQLPDIYLALDSLGIRHTETVNCETDDVITAYAVAYGNVAEIVISSFDSDFFQLISKNVSVFRYRGECSVLCDENYIREKFGISPDQYAQLKALTGDKSDNIKGADNIGPKTAASLLREYGDLENIFRCTDKIKRKSVRVSLSENTDRIRRNLSIIRLNGDAVLPFDLQELEYSDSHMTTTEVLRSIGLK